jgi:hypothetical protein
VLGWGLSDPIGTPIRSNIGWFGFAPAGLLVFRLTRSSTFPVLIFVNAQAGERVDDVQGRPHHGMGHDALRRDLRNQAEEKVK